QSMEKDGNNGTDGDVSKEFRLFRYFRLFPYSLRPSHSKPLKLHYSGAQDAHVEISFSAVEPARAEGVGQLLIREAAQPISHPARAFDRDATETFAGVCAVGIEVHLPPADILDEPLVDET